MKVLVLGGYTRSLWTFRGDLIRAMVDRGHRVTACAPEADPEGRVAGLGAAFLQTPFFRVGTNPLSELKMERMYLEIMRAERPDVVFCYTIKPNVYGPPAAGRAGVPRVYAMVTGLGNAFIAGGGARGALMKFLAGRLYARAARRCDRLIFQNPDDRRDFLGMKLVREDKTALVSGSGVNMERYTPVPMPEQPLFLMISRMIREKGVLVYLEACRSLKKRCPQARCALLGPFEENINAVRRETVDAFVQDGSVEYWGETDDVRPYLARCSALVLPSYREGTPRSVLEAMACGRAVITTDAPGCRETVLPGVSGLLVPPGDPEALSRAMAQMLEQPGMPERMGAAGLDYCRRKYDVNEVNREMLAIMGL